MSRQDFLLDTHVLLWLDTSPERVPLTVLRQLRDPGSIIYVSAASVWELAIKQGLGKLPRLRSADEVMALYRLTELPVRAHHAQAVLELPLHHRDPFDRLLVAQAIAEQLVLVSGDRQLQAYPVALLKC